MDALSTLQSPLVLTIAVLGLGLLGAALAAIAKLRRTQEEMRISKEFFQSTFESAAVGMAVADQGGHYIKVNRAMCNFVGYSEAELLGMSYHDVTHPDDLKENVQARARLLSGELPTFHQEKRYVRKDGQIVWALMVVSQVLDRNGRVAYSVGQMLNIEPQKKVERDLLESRRQLRELSSHQTTLLEEERKHIAREIHDELGQRLTALKMEISLLRLCFGNNPELFRIAEEMRSLADSTIDVVRQVASNLRPAALDLGLVPAIEWLAEDLQLRSEISCQLEIGNEEFIMDETQATVAFRVVQESLTNIARHSGASEVHIALWDGDAQLHLRIHDNGCGFNPVTASKQESFGLLGMRERVLAMGGTLQLDSTPGQGTTVSIQMPLQENDRK